MTFITGQSIILLDVLQYIFHRYYLDIFALLKLPIHVYKQSLAPPLRQALSDKTSIDSPREEHPRLRWEKLPVNRTRSTGLIGRQRGKYALQYL